MLYDFNKEPGHKALFDEVTHVDLSQYQPGQPTYERLMGQLEERQRFQLPQELEFNV